MPDPDYTKVYNFPAYYSGDTITGVRFGLEINGVPHTPDAVRYAIWKRGELENKLEGTCSIGTGYFDFPDIDTATSASSWAQGTYDYEIEVTRSDGLVRTYVKGAIPLVAGRTLP